MILSGRKIEELVGKGAIKIDPFERSRLNPNSYNLRLSNELVIYRPTTLDMKKLSPTYSIEIPEEGYKMHPGVLYLARTMEYTEAHTVVPMLEGRSSIGRLGISVHETAGFGDVGFCGFWTLEMTCVYPVVIYAGVEICQLYFHTIEGNFDPYVSGKYQNNSGIQPSLLYKDFEER